MTFPPSNSGSRIPQEDTDVEHEAYLATLDVAVPCKSASDALLASFFFARHGSPSRALADTDPTLVDEILTLIQSHSFDPKEVSWRSSQDLQQHVVQERRILAERRTASAGPARRAVEGSRGRTESPVPLVVVEMMAQQLASEIRSLSRQIDWDVHVFFGRSRIKWHTCPREDDLLNMAVTHRSWTEPATRALRPRARVMGGVELSRFMSSPRMGPWVREFYFRSEPRGENVAENIGQLARCIQQIPNLQKLALRLANMRMTSGEVLQDTFKSFMEALAHMQDLEQLWLIHDQGSVAALPALCEALSHLPKLRHLDIRNWTQGPGEGPELNTRMARIFSEFPSPQSLTTLSIAHGGMEDISQGFVTWLLNSDPATSSLRHLEMHSKDFLYGSGQVRLADFENEPEPWPLHRALEPFMHLIETLRIHCAAVGLGTTHRLVRSATALRKLSLVGASGFTHFATTPGTLQDSMVFLHLHFSMYPTTALRLQHCLADEGCMPRLRMLRLTKDPLVFDEDDGEEEGPALPPDDWQIDQVRHLCEERRIALQNDYSFLSFEELCNLAVE